MLFMKLIISSIILKHLQKIKLKNGYYHKKTIKNKYSNIQHNNKK